MLYSIIAFSSCVSLDQKPGAPQWQKLRPTVSDVSFIQIVLVKDLDLTNIKSENSRADQRLSYLQILSLTVTTCACLQKTARTDQAHSNNSLCVI